MENNKERIVRDGKVYVKISENKSLEEYCKVYTEERPSVWSLDRELLIITSNGEEKEL